MVLAQTNAQTMFVQRNKTKCSNATDHTEIAACNEPKHQQLFGAKPHFVCSIYAVRSQRLRHGERGVYIEHCKNMLRSFVSLIVSPYSFVHDQPGVWYMRSWSWGLQLTVSFAICTRRNMKINKKKLVNEHFVFVTPFFIMNRHPAS